MEGVTLSMLLNYEIYAKRFPLPTFLCLFPFVKVQINYCYIYQNLTCLFPGIILLLKHILEGMTKYLHLLSILIYLLLRNFPRAVDKMCLINMLN